MLATTLLYLTRNEDGDGAADICTAPLLATVTPALSATPGPAPTSTPPGTPVGVTLPDTGTGGAQGGLPWLGATLILGVLAGALVALRRFA
jgi:hypothetical protein